jgi:hypothetical protein
MAPVIVPGFGMGVAEGARVNVIVVVGAKVGGRVGEAEIVWVLVGWLKVGEESGCEVGEDNGLCCED